MINSDSFLLVSAFLSSFYHKIKGIAPEPLYSSHLFVCLQISVPSGCESSKVVVLLKNNHFKAEMILNFWTFRAGLLWH